MSAMPAHTRALPFFPAGNARSERVDHAGDFVARNARVRNSWSRTFLRVFIAMADAAGVHLETHRSSRRFGNFAIDKLKRFVRLGNLDCAHFGHALSVGFVRLVRNLDGGYV